MALEEYVPGHPYPSYITNISRFRSVVSIQFVILPVFGTLNGGL